MPRYRISIYGQVFKLEDSVPYSYNFRDRKWFESEEAAEHFFDGTGSWEATGKEVITTIREKNNMDFPLTKGTLSKLKKEDLIALMYAEDGAMGSPGEIMVLDNRFRLFRTVCDGHTDITQQDVTDLFDGFEHTDGWMAPDINRVMLNRQPWVYFNLGMGNHLYMRQDFYFNVGNDLFDVKPSTRYKKWNDLLSPKPEKE